MVSKFAATLMGRYCLNDLHRAAGGEQKYRPKYWLDNKQTRELIEQLFTEGGIPPSETKSIR
ncbi:phage protein [Salmonella enterica subsp. enterica]|uniref:Phage protein n=1 Tax=Salmonella enterica I TaxID=59201 RepID=A0A379WW10_SALET|nr:phage protein [Salmonella enterica subsp. enterica]